MHVKTAWALEAEILCMLLRSRDFCELEESVSKLRYLLTAAVVVEGAGLEDNYEPVDAVLLIQLSEALSPELEHLAPRPVPRIDVLGESALAHLESLWGEKEMKHQWQGRIERVCTKLNRTLSKRNASACYHGTGRKVRSKIESRSFVMTFKYRGRNLMTASRHKPMSQHGPLSKYRPQSER
jgi:hypothetical protein